MKVFVTAWHYQGGGGFEWFWTPEAADKAFADEQTNVEELRADSWTAYRFDYESPVHTTRESATTEQRDAITREIDEQLDELCAQSRI